MASYYISASQDFMPPFLSALTELQRMITHTVAGYNCNKILILELKYKIIGKEQIPEGNLYFVI